MQKLISGFRLTLTIASKLTAILLSINWSSYSYKSTRSIRKIIEHRRKSLENLWCKFFNYAKFINNSQQLWNSLNSFFFPSLLARVLLPTSIFINFSFDPLSTRFTMQRVKDKRVESKKEQIFLLKFACTLFFSLSSFLFFLSFLNAPLPT